MELFLKEERRDGDNNYFVGFFFDDRRTLFDRVKFLLPRFAEAEVETAKFTFLFGRFPCAFANGLDYFSFFGSFVGGSGRSMRSSAFSSRSINFSRSCPSRSLMRWTSKAS